MSIFSDPCPASNGTDAACAKVPAPVIRSALSIVFSDADRVDIDHYIPSTYNGPANGQSADQFMSSAPPIKRDGLPPTRYPAIANLAQTIFSSIRIELGNPSPNNFLLDSSVANASLFNTTLNSTDPSQLYLASTNQSIPPLTLDGPATIQVLYPCRLQQAKPIGSAIISVLVATLTMFMSGWAIFMFFISDYAERTREGSESAKTVEQELMLPFSSKEEEAETRSV